MKYFVRRIALLMLLSPLALSAQNTNQDTTEQVFAVVEQQPEYPGGLEAMYRDLSSNLKYPQKALDNKATGRVFVEFVVEKDGSITHVKVVKDEVGYGAGDEVVRCVKKLKNFTPGMQDSKPVRTIFRLPVNFDLDIEKPKKKGRNKGIGR